MFVTTKRCQQLDRLRKKLGLAGHVKRDRTSHSYVLVDGDAVTPLGERWRDAESALRAKAR